MSGGLTPTMPDVVPWHGSSTREEVISVGKMNPKVIIAVATAIAAVITACGGDKDKD